MNRKQLVELCSAFHLPYSGSKPKLKARLRAFSLDRKRWQRYDPFFIFRVSFRFLTLSL